MKILYVNSGSPTFHAAIDSYIFRTLQKMDCEVRQFDLLGHLRYFSKAMGLAKESYGIDYDGPTLGRYAAAPLLSEVDEFQPDLVIAMHGAFLPQKLVETVRRLGSTTALWVVDDPYEIDNAIVYAGSYDHIFTVDSSAVSIYKGHGCPNVFHLPLAAYPPVHRQKTVPSRYQSDVCFIGSAFYNRLKLFDEIADYLSTLNLKIIGQWWEKLESFSKLEPFIVNDTIGPGEAASYYSGAKINLNLHRGSDAAAHFEGNKLEVKAVSPNNRTFEIAGCGGFQIVDNVREDLGKYFTIGQEIETFESPQDLVEKIKHYLGHPDKRLEIAKNAAQRSCKEHTFKDRLGFMLDVTEISARKRTSFQVNEIPRISQNKSHEDYWQVNQVLLKMVPDGVRKVLDVGCKTGYLGKSLKEKGAKEVVGIEPSIKLAQKAEHQLDQVIIGDIEASTLPFSDDHFDCIVYRNVLQQLKDPRKVLRDHKKLLRDGGYIVGCVNNIAYYPVIKDLLAGRWQYEKSGPLDDAHLRFFTVDGIVKMFDDAGYEVVDITGCAYEEIDEEEIRRFAEFLRPLDLLPKNFPSMSSFAQFVLVARDKKEQSVEGRANLQ